MPIFWKSVPILEKNLTDNEKIDIAKLVIEIILFQLAMLKQGKNSNNFPECVKSFWEKLFKGGTHELQNVNLQTLLNQHKNMIPEDKTIKIEEEYLSNNEKLLAIHDSFFETAKASLEKTFTFSRTLLTQNLLTGIVNGDFQLLEKVKKITKEQQLTISRQIAIRYEPQTMARPTHHI